MPEPVQLKFAFDLPNQAGTHYLDISQICSLVNRKFLRQGMNWVVSNIELFSNVTSQVAISKLPDTWTMANSWTKSFKLWQRSQDQVLDLEPTIQSSYSDFKIFFDSDHQLQGGATNLLPFGYDIVAASATYDWDRDWETKNILKSE